MQTALSQKMSLAGTPVRASVPTSAPRRVAVVVRAEAESRRAVLGGLFAGVAALTASKAGAIELIDDRKALDKGFNLIYEARDLDLPQATRDGFTQARESLDATKKRVAESEKRIDSVLKGYIDKQYWTLAREELRLQVGTLRFDLNALTDAKGGKAEKKKVDDLKKAFLQAVSDLDFSLRKKDPAAAQQRLVAATTSLDNVLAVL